MIRNTVSVLVVILIEGICLIVELHSNYLKIEVRNSKTLILVACTLLHLQNDCSIIIFIHIRNQCIINRINCTVKYFLQCAEFNKSLACQIYGTSSRLCNLTGSIVNINCFCQLCTRNIFIRNKTQSIFQCQGSICQYLYICPRSVTGFPVLIGKDRSTVILNRDILCFVFAFNSLLDLQVNVQSTSLNLVASGSNGICEPRIRCTDQHRGANGYRKQARKYRLFCNSFLFHVIFLLVRIIIL